MTHHLRLFVWTLSVILVFNVKSTVSGQYPIVFDGDSVMSQLIYKGTLLFGSDSLINELINRHTAVFDSESLINQNPECFSNGSCFHHKVGRM